MGFPEDGVISQEYYYDYTPGGISQSGVFLDVAANKIHQISQAIDPSGSIHVWNSEDRITEYTITPTTSPSLHEVYIDYSVGKFVFNASESYNEAWVDFISLGSIPHAYGLNLTNQTLVEVQEYLLDLVIPSGIPNVDIVYNDDVFGDLTTNPFLFDIEPITNVNTEGTQLYGVGTRGFISDSNLDNQHLPMSFMSFYSRGTRIAPSSVAETDVIGGLFGFGYKNDKYKLMNALYFRENGWTLSHRHETPSVSGQFDGWTDRFIDFTKEVAYTPSYNFKNQREFLAQRHVFTKDSDFGMNCNSVFEIDGKNDKIIANGHTKVGNLNGSTKPDFEIKPRSTKANFPSTGLADGQLVIYNSNLYTYDTVGSSYLGMGEYLVAPALPSTDDAKIVAFTGILIKNTPSDTDDFSVTINHFNGGTDTYNYAAGISGVIVEKNLRIPLYEKDTYSVNYSNPSGVINVYAYARKSVNV